MNRRDLMLKLIAERGQVLCKLFELDGVPMDLFTYYALISIGVELAVIEKGKEHTAIVLEQWAHNVRNDIRMSTNANKGK